MPRDDDVMTLIIVPFILSLGPGKGEGCFLFFFIFPRSFVLLVVSTAPSDAVTDSAPEPACLGLRCRLMFRSACIACIFLVSECWFLVRNSALISKLSWDL